MCAIRGTRLAAKSPEGRMKKSEMGNSGHSAHRVGAAIGAVSAGVAGAAAGAAMGGPVGAIVGAAAGAAVGAVAGNCFVSEFDADEEAAYWSDQYQFRPYYRSGTTFADYEPAYRYGWESARRPEFRHRRLRGTRGRAGRRVAQGAERRRGRLEALSRRRARRLAPDPERVRGSRRPRVRPATFRP